MRKPAASPATSTPSAHSCGIIPAPSSGTRWALYSTTLPPRRSRWTAGCMRNFVWRSWTSIFLRDKSSDETTSPRETEALFVYRNPPPRRPIDACPAYTNAAPSFSPRPNRSWIASGGSSTVSLIPTETSRGSRSDFRAVLRPFRKQLDQGPRIDATPEHPLHSGSPAALDEKGREALAGEGQRGRGARGPGPHHDDIKTLHALPVPLRKSGTGKRLSAGSRHRHRLQLELAPLVALRGARELFAEKLLPDEEAADPGHPTGEEVAHRLLRGAVRLGDRAVVSRHREPTSIRVEVDDLRPPPSGERGRVDDSLRAVHRQREGDTARQRAEEFQTGVRAPLAGQIQDPFGGSAHRLFELPLDAHDDLGAEDETRLVRETQDPGFRIGMEGRRKEFARLLRVQV